MNNLLRSILISTCLLFGIGMANAAPAVNFSPENSTVSKDSQFTINVTAKDFQDLFSYQLSIRFDPACVTPLIVREGEFLKSAGADTYFSTGIFDNSIGIVANNTGSIVGQNPGVSGDGRLFSIEFKAIAACSNEQLLFDDGIFLNSSFNEIATDYTAANINIKEHSQALFSGLLAATGAEIDDQGDVYIWGFRSSAQQGNGIKHVKSRAAPAKVSSLSNIQSITGGAYHLLALDTSGNVWGWGRSVHGESGCKGAYVSTPCKVLSNAKQIAAGEYFSLALDNNGQVWSWGYNLHGQLGTNGTPKKSDTPIAVNLNGEKVRLIGTADESAFAVTEQGQVWVWGNNKSSGLSLDLSAKTLSKKTVKAPTRAANLAQYADQIIYISGGDGWGEALLDDGRVIGWGLHEAIGQGVTSSHQFSAKPVPVLDNVKQLVAGYQGSFALTNDDLLYTWGETHCGSSKIIYGAKPTYRSNVNGIPVAIGGGKKHLLYKNADGELYGVGYNDTYKLDQDKCCGNVNWPGSQIAIK